MNNERFLTHVVRAATFVVVYCAFACALLGQATTAVLLMSAGVFYLLVRFAFWLVVKVTHARLKAHNRARLRAWNNPMSQPARIARGVLMAYTDDGQPCGTAFVVEGGIIVTNRHVALAIGPGGFFTTRQGTRLETAPLLVCDAETEPDLAFYNLPDMPDDITPLALCPGHMAPKRQDRLMVLGHRVNRPPYYAAIVEMAGPYWVLFEEPGFSTFIHRWHDAFVHDRGKCIDRGASLSPRYTHMGDTGPGHSGSPVVNHHGHVVGVHFAGPRLFWLAREQYGFDVSLEALHKHLHRAYTLKLQPCAA